MSSPPARPFGPIDRKWHIEIGLAALARGLVDARGLAEVMADVGFQGGGPDPVEVWVGPDRLSMEELEDIAREIGAMQGAGAGVPAWCGVTVPILNEPENGPATRLTAGPPGGADRYKVLGLLASGGVGDVMKCRDASLRRHVALKVLRAEIATDASAASMLLREAELTGSLEHPSIIPVYDVGVRDDLGAFYVMRLVEQPSLADVLAKLREGDQAAISEFTLGRLLRCFIQACNAVDYAHSRGVVHCDIKPSNILVGSFGEVLVVDWGLAYVGRSPNAYSGGTPGFMAPEQLGAEHGLVDARTDVFALGAVLYEIVCGEQAFPEESIKAMMSAIRTAATSRPMPVPPRQRAPHKSIPRELDAVCMRALELHPAARFQSARDLASAVEAFLEGRRAREHREARAAELLQEGARMAEGYEELLQSRPERLEEVRAIRAEIAPWEGPHQKRALWDAEDRLIALDQIAARTLQAAISAYEQALDEVPGHVEARRGLGKLYWMELLRAEESGDDADRAYFDNILKQYEDVLFTEASSKEGTLSIEASPDRASVTLITLEERDRRLLPIREQALGHAPIARISLSPGHYIAVLRREGLASDVHVPVLVRAGREHAIAVDLKLAEDLRPGEVLVPGGPALLGGDEPTPGGGERRLVDVPSFILAKRHVSFAEYLEFVRDLLSTDPSLATASVPCSASGAPFWRWDGERFVPSSLDLWGYSEEALLALPAFGVSAQSARAYAAWVSRQAGLPYRLPTDDEWEKAARGTDGRRYPWGDHFDASFCVMRESRPGTPRPEPSGTGPFDVSPYGVLDMAGGMADWVTPNAAQDGEGELFTEAVASRGGAWCDWWMDCRLSIRRHHLSEERTPRVGFRLARTKAAL
jgi:serine/threonine-protein kinase